MKIYGVLLFFLCLFAACGEKREHHGKTLLVEVAGEYLYKEDLQNVLPPNLSKDDSLLFAEHFIRNWVEEVLLYDKAKDNIPDDAGVEELVGSYRKALIVHTYQQELIEQKLSKDITEQEMKDYYENNKGLFVLEKPLIKGLFMKVPVGASGLNNVRKWYKKNTQENIEHLEKYSLQNAVNYDYFYDKWLPASGVLDKIPLRVSDSEAYLARNKTVEVRDSAFYYFLNVDDYLGVGEQEPYEAAQKKIRDILTNQKSVSYISGMKDDLYESAVKRNKIIYY